MKRWIAAALSLILGAVALAQQPAQQGASHDSSLIGKGVLEKAFKNSVKAMEARQFKAGGVA